MVTTTEPATAWLLHNGEPMYATAVDFQTVWDKDTTFPFFEDEDAYGVYGFGHQDKATYAALVNDFDARCCGYEVAEDDKYTAADVIHCWAVVVRPHEDQLQFSWAGVSSMTLGSWPLTRIDR
jgi:hypothetical protein